jgi:hypothetical protein
VPVSLAPPKDWEIEGQSYLKPPPIEPLIKTLLEPMIFLTGAATHTDIHCKRKAFAASSVLWLRADSGRIIARNEFGEIGAHGMNLIP